MVALHHAFCCEYGVLHTSAPTKNPWWTDTINAQTEVQQTRANHSVNTGQSSIHVRSMRYPGSYSTRRKFPVASKASALQLREMLDGTILFFSDPAIAASPAQTPQDSQLRYQSAASTNYALACRHGLNEAYALFSISSRILG